MSNRKKYIEAAIDNEVAIVANAISSTRNQTLNRAAFNAGARLVSLPESHPLHRVSDNIRALTATLEQIQPSEIKLLADQEEQGVQELQGRRADLKQRVRSSVRVLLH